MKVSIQKNFALPQSQIRSYGLAPYDIGLTLAVILKEDCKLFIIRDDSIKNTYFN